MHVHTIHNSNINQKIYIKQKNGKKEGMFDKPTNT